MEEISNFEIGDFRVHYLRDKISGRTGTEWTPRAISSLVQQPVDGSTTRPLESLVQIKILGDSYPGAFAQGHTMRNSDSIDDFKFENQVLTQKDGMNTVLTVLRSTRGHVIEHLMYWLTGDSAAWIETSFRNDSDKPVTLEMLSTFSFGGITPFRGNESPGRLLVHRFRSAWSAEGRLDTQTVENLHLEPSWNGAGAFSERFGQIGTMPVRRWFPFLAIEDRVEGVFWGAQLAWAGSWQMEVYRRHADLAISGGLADREFGHWMKQLNPGEKLTTPPAAVACVHGSLADLCDSLTSLQNQPVEAQPAVERDLPIVFNEWCTTWGEPRHDTLIDIADRLKGSPVRYLVIDAGWYKTEDAIWDGCHGDWVPNTRLFPEGLARTAAAIRERGLIPGLWFEMETVGYRSAAFNLVDDLLKRDGIPITTRGRRFWNLADLGVVERLANRVIGILESCGFGYLKVDYNETLGIGCDHPDSLGEGLRVHVEAIYRFFELVQSRLPDLVIENCASGGHRLEPSMLARTALSSFSDAHELVEIPIIAANLQQLMLPRQSLVWAVLHPADDAQRLAYILSAAFLGRMCLSGDVVHLSAEQWQLVNRAMEFYRGAACIIKEGHSRRYGAMGESWRVPTGWQAVVRQSLKGDELLLVIHLFGDAPERISVPLPRGSWHMIDQFPSVSGCSVSGCIEGENFIAEGMEDFSACSLRFKMETA